MTGDKGFSKEVQAMFVQAAMEPTRWKMTKAQRENTFAGLSIIRELIGGELEYGPGDAVDEILSLTLESGKFDEQDLIAGLSAVGVMLLDHTQVVTGVDWDTTLRTLDTFIRSIELADEPPEGTETGPPEGSTD
jgi:hypothetical protein